MKNLFFKTQSMNLALALQAHFLFGIALITFLKSTLHIDTYVCIQHYISDINCPNLLVRKKRLAAKASMLCADPSVTRD